MEKLSSIIVSSIVLVIIGLLFSFPVMWLYNDLSVKMFNNTKSIDISTAFELYVFMAILCKSNSKTSK